MDLVVEHDTTYTYAAPLRHSIQYLRLRPHQSALQTVWQWSVTGPEALTQFRDGFGNDVDVLAVTRPHQTFTVAVRGRVSTIDGDGLLPVESEVLPVEVFLRSTNLTAITPEIDDLARASAGGAKGIAAVESLIAAVAERVPYRGGLTNPATTAADALRVGGGVCQDHSHLLVACCRAVGIPARYISGYYWADAAGAEYEANHAWIEAYVGDQAWMGFDGANQQRVSDAYVRLAAGLDYRDAAPVRGMRRGGGLESLSVRVRVAAAQSQQ